MTGPRQTDRQRRIIQLADEWHIVLPPAPYSLTRPSQIPTFKTPNDDAFAEDLLKRRQLVAAAQNQSPSLKRAFTTRRKGWEPKELFDALDEHVANAGSPGVAEALIQKLVATGGDMNTLKKKTGLLNRRRSLENLGERSRILHHAVKNGQIQMVELLATHADSVALDTAIPIAIRNLDLPIVELLLRYGANVSQTAPAQEAFRQLCAAGGHADLVRLILLADGRPSRTCISAALVDATRAGCLDSVLHLSRSTADGNFNDAEAFKASVESNRPDITISIAMGNHPPQRPGLDDAFTALFTRPDANQTDTLAMAEIILCAGAAGEAVSIALIHAAAAQNFDLVRLLVQYGASLEFQDALVLKSAVSKGQSELVEALLQNCLVLSPACSDECIRMIPKQTTPSIRHALLCQLLPHTSSANSMSEVLIDSVQDGDIESAKLLLERESPVNGRASLPSSRHRPVASVNHREGLALQISVAGANLNMTKVLLSGAPNMNTISRGFLAARGLPHDVRYDIIECFLAAGLSGPPLDNALQEAIGESPPQRDDNLINLYMSYNANVNFSGGAALVNAIAQGDSSLFSALLKGATPQTAGALIPRVMELKDGDMKREMVSSLLQAGAATGTKDISAATLTVLKDTPTDIRLLRTLLQQGNANVNGLRGEIICEAIRDPDPTILEMVIRLGHPSLETIEKGIPALGRIPSTQVKATKLQALIQSSKPRNLDHLLACEINSILKTPPESRSLATLRVLLSVPVDINTNNSAPLCQAVAAGNSQLTDLLLTARPTPKSVALALPHALNIADPMDRMTFTQILLEAGAPAAEANRALVFATETYPDDLPLLKILAASADTSDGEALCAAVGRGRPHIVNILLASGTTPTAILDTSLQKSMTLADRDVRMAISGALLQAKPSRGAISMALLQAASESDLILGKSLLDHGASLAECDGRAVVQAARSGSADILQLLLGGEPDTKMETLEQAFQAGTEIGDLKKRAAVFTVLLNKGVRGQVIDNELISATRYGNDGTHLVKILLMAGANPNHHEGEAVCAATRSAFLGNLELLLGRIQVGSIQQKPNITSLTNALKSSWALSRETRYTAIQWLFHAGLDPNTDVHITLSKALNEEDPDVHLVKLLLANGASPVVNGCRAIIDAASHTAVELLPLLIGIDISPSDLSWIFSQSFTGENYTTWMTDAGMECFKLLLLKGAKGDGVSSALSVIVEMHSEERQQLEEAFIDILLAHGADINFENGKPLQLVASSGNASWIKKLLSGGRATPETLSGAFIHIFDKEMNHDEAVEIAGLFVDYNDGASRLDLSPLSNGSSILVNAMSRYPRSAKLVEKLLEAGCYYDQLTPWQVFPNVEEAVTILMWAILQPQKGISTSIIEVLVDSGAKVNFETKESRTTPLMVAIQTRRQDVVKILLLKGADVDVVDATGNSPLAMASGLGGELAIAIMSNLLAAGAPKNDGSLHNAARELNLPAVQVLVHYGHDPDFPSPLHGGRSALGELCLHSTDEGEMSISREKQMERVMTFLIDQKSDLTIKSHGKSILHLALESHQPVPTTRILLRTGFWKVLNSPINQFDDGTYIYSPTAYTGRLLQSPHKPAILKLLYDSRATDVFYAKSGPQPKDATGLPEHLQAKEQARLAHLENQALEDSNHRLRLARALELTSIDDQRRKKARNEELTFLREKQQIEEESFNALLRRKSADRLAELSHQQALADSTLARTRAIGEEELRLENSRKRLALEWEGKLSTERVDNAKALSAIRIAEKQDLDRVDRLADERFNKRLKEQKRLVDSQMGLANRLAGHGFNQRQIGFIAGEAD